MSQKETAAEGVEGAKAEAARLIALSKQESESMFLLSLAWSLICAESRGYLRGLKKAYDRMDADRADAMEMANNRSKT